MTLKKSISTLLLLFVVGSLAYMAFDEFGPGTKPEAPEVRVPGVEPRVIVYFFDEGKDCSTCEKLEGYAHEALETHFPEELASGALAWRRLSVEEPEHKHFVTDYALYTKSEVLVERVGGQQVRWKNLEDIWNLVYDKPAYIEYIVTHTRDFLGTAP